MLLSALPADKSSDAADESDHRGALPANYKSSAVDKPRDRMLIPLGLLAALMLVNLLRDKSRQKGADKWSFTAEPKTVDPVGLNRRAFASALANELAADKSSAADNPRDRSLAAAVALADILLRVKSDTDKAAEKLENKWSAEKKDLRDKWFADMLD